MYNKVRRKVFDILEASAGDSFLKKIFDYFIICLIILNTLFYIMESVDTFAAKYYNTFLAFETFSVAVFTIEYILRLWTCTFIEKYRRPVFGRIKYIFSLYALIDLLAFLPFYLYTMTLDLIFIRVLRLFRFIRLFKLGRYSDAVNVLGKVFKSKKEELVLTISISLILIVVSSSFIYIAEHDAQPDKFKNIPESMYWAVTTLTSVGYGDICPITPIGKFLTSIISLIGLGMVALPTGILASAFSKEFKKKKNICPHCGKEIT
ncbi:MAG: ion transporter [Ignavibacteriae bacterium]|nr:ion transporter [Ignavibacteriota bacterium]